MRMALFSSKNEIRPPFDRKLSKLTLTIRNKSHAARPFTLPHITAPGHDHPPRSARASAMPPAGPNPDAKADLPAPADMPHRGYGTPATRPRQGAIHSSPARIVVRGRYSHPTHPSYPDASSSPNR